MPSYLTQADVATRFNVSDRTVKEWVIRRRVPHRKLPGVRSVVFIEHELDQWADDPLVELEIRVGKDGARVVRPRRRA